MGRWLAVLVFFVAGCATGAGVDAGRAHGLDGGGAHDAAFLYDGSVAATDLGGPADAGPPDLGPDLGPADAGHDAGPIDLGHDAGLGCVFGSGGAAACPSGTRCCVSGVGVGICAATTTPCG